MRTDDLSPQQEQGVERFAKALVAAYQEGGEIRYWGSTSGDAIILRHGERAYRLPVHALDAPGDLSPDDYEVGFAPAQDAIDRLADAAEGKAGADEVDAALGKAADELQALSADLGADFDVVRRVRLALKQLEGVGELLRGGDDKGVLRALVAAQQALIESDVGQGRERRATPSV
ncbi:MAG: hypothetical protein ACRDJ4_10405 [Actinomycetota bacterium]